VRCYERKTRTSENSVTAKFGESACSPGPGRPTQKRPCARIASDGRGGAGEGTATIRYRRDSGCHTTPLVGVLAVSLGPNKDDRRLTIFDNQEPFPVCKRIIYPTEEMRLELDGAMMLVLRDGLGVGGSQLSSSTH
jgi:hypothetical protein